MTLDDLQARFKVIDSVNAAKWTKYVSDVEVSYDQVGSNTWKIIPRLISLVFSVCRDHNVIDLFQRERHEIAAETGTRQMTCCILNIQCKSKNPPPLGDLTFFIFSTNG